MIENFNIYLEKNTFISIINSYVQSRFPNRSIPNEIPWIMNKNQDIIGVYNICHVTDEDLKVKESCEIIIKYNDKKAAIYNFLKVYCKDMECPRIQTFNIKMNEDFSGVTVSWTNETTDSINNPMTAMTTTR